MSILETFLDIHTKDAQNRKRDLTFEIKPSAYGATTIPVAAKIDAVIASIFGPDNLTPSLSIVTGYAIRIEELDPAEIGGPGSSASSDAFRVRNVVGEDTEFLFSIPGADKSAVLFDPTNPNSVVMTTGLWSAVRAALVDAAIAISSPEDSYVAISSGQIAQSSTFYDGRVSPPRPR